MCDGGDCPAGGRETNAFESGASSWSELWLLYRQGWYLGDEGWSFGLALEVARRVVVVKLIKTRCKSRSRSHVLEVQQVVAVQTRAHLSIGLAGSCDE